jgi:hypothetical protein
MTTDTKIQNCFSNHPDAEDDAEDGIIYHVKPEEVIIANPELVGKVKQAYIICRQCCKWEKLTTDNSITLPFGTKMSFKYKHYFGGICLTEKCNMSHYVKGLKNNHS